MGCSLTGRSDDPGGTALEFAFFSKTIVCSVALVGEEEDVGVGFAVPAKRERSRVTFDFPEDLFGQIVSLRFARETALSGIEACGLSVASPVVQRPARSTASKMSRPRGKSTRAMGAKHGRLQHRVGVQAEPSVDNRG